MKDKVGPWIIRVARLDGGGPVWQRSKQRFTGVPLDACDLDPLLTVDRQYAARRDISISTAGADLECFHAASDLNGVFLADEEKHDLILM